MRWAQNITEKYKESKASFLVAASCWQIKQTKHHRIGGHYWWMTYAETIDDRQDDDCAEYFSDNLQHKAGLTWSVLKSRLDILLYWYILL